MSITRNTWSPGKQPYHYTRDQPVQVRSFPFTRGSYSHTDERGRIHLTYWSEGRELSNHYDPDEVFPLGPPPYRNPDLGDY